MRFFRIKASFCIQCMHYQDWGIQANFWQKRRKKYPWKLSIWRASHLKWPLLYIFFLNVCCEFMQKAMARNWWLLLLFDTKKAGVGSSFQLVTKELPIEPYANRYCMTWVIEFVEIHAADLTGSQIFRPYQQFLIFPMYTGSAVVPEILLPYSITLKYWINKHKRACLFIQFYCFTLEYTQL